MLVTVRLIIQCDNFMDLSEKITYEVLGEETLLENSIFVSYTTFKNIVADLKNIMFECDHQRNSTDIIFNQEGLLLEYRILNIPENYDTSQFNGVLNVFKEYLDKYKERSRDAFEGRTNDSNKTGQLLNIKSLGINLAFEELEMINDYLKEENINYELIQLDSSSVEVGASGGFSNILILLSSGADFLTVITAIQDLLKGQESSVVIKEIDNILLEKAQELISERYYIHVGQILFEMQKNKEDNKLFVFKTRPSNKYYQVIFDSNNNLLDIGYVDDISNIS